MSLQNQIKRHALYNQIVLIIISGLFMFGLIFSSDPERLWLAILSGFLTSIIFKIAFGKRIYEYFLKNNIFKKDISESE